MVMATVVTGYALGVIHGGLTVGLVAVVMLVFHAHTGSIWQLAGAWGEDNTSDELRKAKRQGHIWGWVDNVEVADGDVDHLVLARGGAFALDSKWHARDVNGDLLESDARQARRAAERARSVLLSLKTPMTVRPVVVVWGSAARSVPTAGARLHEVDFVAGPHFARWLARVDGGSLDRVRAATILKDLHSFRARVNPRTARDRRSFTRVPELRDAVADNPEDVKQFETRLVTRSV